MPRQAWAAPSPHPADEAVAPSDAPQPVATPTDAPPKETSEPVTDKDRPDVEVAQDRPATDAVKPPASSLQPMSLPTGENKTGVSAQSISVPKGPGTIQGMGESFSAQASTGIATFSVPFAIPAARGAAQASLSLSYSSSGGNGVAGIGWGFGVPFIARQTDRGLPKYLDQTTWHAEQDRFVYNGGQELVPVSALPGEVLPEWATGWQYFRPRVEGSYLRFFWNPSERLWRVQDKAGVVLELGVVAGQTDALETDPANANHVFKWNLKRQIDAHGNIVWYQYTAAGNQAWLSDIYHTFPTTFDGSSGPPQVDSAAYRVHIVYEDRDDVSRSYRRGWETGDSKRLSGVEISARDDAMPAGRRAVRAYALSYVSDSHLSLLQSVKVQGRCGEAQPGEKCTLPPMRFGYTHVASDTEGEGAFVDGYETLDSTVRSMTGSPKHSVDDEYTDLYDVNSDGLPDVVAMLPGSYGGKHGLWLNGKDGTADRFGAQEPMGVLGVLGGTTSTITKHNSNLAALDLNGDATIDLLHMPKVKTYSVYTPEYRTTEWKWVGREVKTADNLDARIDLGTDAEETRVFDVNGDGLVDVVKTSGTALEVWFALGRYPGGDGLFGSGTWTTADTAQLSMVPVMRCVPWSSTPVRFSDPDIKLADMNGDGLMDIVRIRKGDIRYWPGRGDGTFGTGPLGCAGGTFSSNSFVQMTASPYYTDPDNSGLRLDDVNGDGTSDLVQIRFQGIDVWYNVDGASWQNRRIIDDTPASPSYQQRVRLVDMNGSGTTDILWGDGYAYKYIDLAAGKRPWLLNRVENGLGKTTEIGWTTSTAQMLAAESAKKWTKRSPVILHMVETVTVKDNLAAIGRPAGEYVTTYAYRDPYYDGLQREFRGFSETTVTTVGDTNSPTSASVSSFLLGQRPAGDLTHEANRWKDNPHEALKGLPQVTESYATATKAYLSTEAVTYALRKLYEGRDGRGVYAAFARQTDKWLYDTWPFVPQPSPAAAAVPQLGEQVAGDEAISPSVALKSSIAKRIASSVTVDVWGNRLTETAYGVVGEDEQLTSHTVPERVDANHALGKGGWAWRTSSGWVTGSVNAAERHKARTIYDPFGDPQETQAWLQDVGGLQREVAESLPDDQHPADFAGWVTTGKTQYDGFGNVVFRRGPNHRCASVAYDGAYHQLAETEAVYAGLAGPNPEDCGTTELRASATYDRGLQAPLTVTDVTGATTTAGYDSLGRIYQIFAPRPDRDDVDLPAATTKVQYILPDDNGSPPYSRLVTMSQDGSDEGAGDYHVAHAFIDGLGRTIAALAEADPEVDGYQWIVGGLTDYDRKGAERRKYLPWSWDGADPSQYPLSVEPTTPYGQQRYDAFGRAIHTIGLDGTITLETHFHALSADAWDAEDLGPGEHQGTYASEEKDGHGRVTQTTERVRVNGKIEARFVRPAYLPSGEVTSITRSAPGKASVSRTMQYDSVGRMTVNDDPNTSRTVDSVRKTWRYAYNDAGDLIGTSDARGCGVNFAYDAAGRLVTEDYAPCEAHHAAYSKYVPEVGYWYDADDLEDAGEFKNPDCHNGGKNSVQGRLVSVTDRSGKSMTCYDQRGRTIEVARQLVDPYGNRAGRWYNRQAQYDAADRAVMETTGASVPPGVTSYVATSYTQRGTVNTVTSPYGTLVEGIKREPDRMVTEIKYGDGAHTTTSLTYDDLRRLHNQTTYRASFGPSGTLTTQMLLQDEEFVYDRVGNPVEIRDWRIADEWPTGAKPVTRKMRYDDLYRLVRMGYEYEEGADTWTDPYAAEQEAASLPDNTRDRPMPRADFGAGHRVLEQSWQYDWLGNTVATDDDQHAFWDRSLGTVGNGTPDEGAYKLKSAGNTAAPGDHTGSLTTDCDEAGDLINLTVERAGTCVGGNPCGVMHFAYDWDEVGRLVRARRWDAPNLQSIPPPDTTAQATLEYVYDSSDQRTRKTAVDGAGHQLHSL